MNTELDTLAAEVYDYCCSNRGDNMKGGVPGNPRNVGCAFEELFEQPKEFYRNVVRWHLTQQDTLKAATLGEIV